MKDNNKRNQILDIGARLMLQKGYNHTGIQEILQLSGVPKGSFYYYFKSKEDFGLQVIDHFSIYLEQQIHDYLDDEHFAYVQRIRNFFNEFLIAFEESDFVGGCPLGNLALELADSHEIFRGHLRDKFKYCIDLISQCLEQGQKNNEFSSEMEAGQLAQFIFFSWEGTIMHMKLSRSKEPLDQFNYFVFDQLIKRNNSGV